MAKKKRPGPSSQSETPVPEPDQSSNQSVEKESNTPSTDVETLEHIPVFKNSKFVHSGKSVSGKKNRVWKSLKQITTSEKAILNAVTYSCADSPPSLKPVKKYSDVSGLKAKYTDPVTKLRYANAAEFQLIRSLTPESGLERLSSYRFYKIFIRGCHSAVKPYFITTPIFYVNGAPHIGHLQSCLFADALHRTQLLLGKNSILSTGTDEHGLKIQQAAKSVGKDTLQFCSEFSNQFKDVFSSADILYSCFIRTTDDKHKRAVQHFWEELNTRGFIYKGQYEGWYDVSDETFVANSQIKEVKESGTTKMVCADTGHVLEKMHEDNYIFRLSKLKDDLLYWLSQDVIKPKFFAKDVERWLNETLQDLSVSRQRSRLPWGIPVPGDDTQTVYVWLDALVNYLTVAGYPEQNMVWPADCQVIGKDILKFHAIYWPAFLIAAGLSPPTSIFCHSHWTVNYEKMSKSKGNVVNPKQLIEQYDCDGFRYFLLRSSVPHSDTNFNETKIFRLLNAELADTFGNLLSRCCAPAVNKDQVFPPFSKTAFSKMLSDDDGSMKDLIGTATSLPRMVLERYQECDFFHGIELIMDCSRKANTFIQCQKPWESVRGDDMASRLKLNTTLYIALEVLRVGGLLLQPIIPTMARELLDKLGIEQSERTCANINCFPAIYGSDDPSKDRSLGGNKCILFARRKASN